MVVASLSFLLLNCIIEFINMATYVSAGSSFTYSAIFGSVRTAVRGWARVPSLDTSTLNWDLEVEKPKITWAERLRAPRPIKRVRGPAQMAPRNPPPPVEDLFTIPFNLGFKFVAPTKRAEREELARKSRAFRRKIRDMTTPAERPWRVPKTLYIAGVKCPQLGRSMWRPYIRRPLESFGEWQRRIKRIVAAFWQGKRIAAHNRNLDGSPFEQLVKIMASNGLLHEQLLEEVLLNEEPEISGKIVLWPRKLRVPQVAKFIGPMPKPRGYGFAEACLERKLQLAKLWEEFHSRRKQRVARCRRVYSFNDHRVFFLRPALEKLLLEHVEEVIKNDPEAAEAFQAEVPQGNMYFEKDDDLLSCFTRLDNSSKFLDNSNNFIPCSVGPLVARGEMADAPEKSKSDVKGDNKSAQGDAAKPTTEKIGNVAIEKAEGVSTSNPIKPMPMASLVGISSKASTEKVDDLVNRFITIKQCTWSTQKQGEELCSLTLPLDALNNSDFQNSPNYAPFQVHTYWRGNMRIKILANANIRQYGQLQIVAYYGADFDGNWPTRDNIWTRSQMPHVLITAPSSNSAEFLIPYDFVNPVLRISRGADSWFVKETGTSELANLCRLSIRVIIPLNSAECTAKEVDLSIGISFEDNHFSGMVDKRVVEFKPKAEMFSIAAMYAIKEVMDRIDKNRDNPTVNAVGTPILGVNASSWCHGSGMAEFSNVLRLNPVSCATYPSDRMPAENEMDINFVKRIYGMFKIVHWDTQYKPGELLLKFEASPIFDPSNYPVVVKDQTTCYAIPPIGILSSLNCYWTGSLELRLDIVGATELTGRLVVAYVPRYFGELTLQQAFNCTHSIFNLQGDNRQFVFNIPYVADKMFWDRRKILQSKDNEYSTYQPPGSVYVFVYNKLVVNCTVPSDCYLICYLRGGEDFHVAVPAFPNFALSFNSQMIIPITIKDKAVSIDGYFPVFIGSWYQFYAEYSADRQHLPIFRYGDYTSHIAQFRIIGNPDVVLGKYCTFVSPAANYSFTWQMKAYWKEGGSEKSEKFDKTFKITGGFVINVEGYIYLIPAFSEDFARCMLAHASSHMTLNGLRQWFQLPFIAFSNNHQFWANDPDFGKYRGKSGVLFDYADYTTDSPVLDGTNQGRVVLKYKELKPYPETVVANAIGDERSSNVATPIKVLPSGAGATPQTVVFGETFDDLKDYCRRYQLYATVDFKIDKSNPAKIFTIKVPIKFQGLPLTVDTSPKSKDIYNNRVRDGVIPYIASGYRFAYGGIRFRLSFLSNSSYIQNTKITVQHRPDILPEDKVVLEDATTIGNNDLILPGYASYTQFLATNHVISVEIPAYLPISKVWLQESSDNYTVTRWGNMGSLAIGIEMGPRREGDFRMDIHYALADDARFSNFVGFPPMLDLTSLPPEDLVSEAIASEYEFVGDEIVKGEMNAEGDGGSFFSSWNPFKKTTAAIDNISKVDVENLNETIGETKSFVQNLTGALENILPSVSKVGETIKDYTSTIITAISNFIHCLLNTSIASITTSIMAILAQLKLVSFKSAEVISSKLSDLFSFITRSSNKQNGEEAVANMAHDESEEDSYKCAYISTLVAAIAAALALTPRLCSSNWKSFGILLMDGIKNFAMTANHLFTFIKNNLLVIQKIANKLVNHSPSLKDVLPLKDTQEAIYNWCESAINILDPRAEMRLFSDIKMCSKVHLLAARGHVILLSLGKIKIDTKQFSVIRELYSKLEKLRSRLTKMHLAPPVRFEPFVVEVTGSTGVGKTTLVTGGMEGANGLAIELFKHLNLTHAGELIYHRQLGNPHWNGCKNQPVFFVDEKFPIAKQGFDDVQIAELFMIKSRCIFNPLMADLPDKDIRYNPILAFYCSNNAFPSLTGILDSLAVSRRRDVLIKMRWSSKIWRKYNPTGKNKNFTLKDLTADERNGWNCCEFAFKGDVKDEHSAWSPYKPYKEFLQDLKARWFQYYITEQAIFERNLIAALSCYPEEGQEWSTIDNQWFNMIEEKFGDRDVLEFKAALRELVTLETYKKMTDKEKSLNYCKILKKFFCSKAVPDDQLEKAIGEVKDKIMESYRKSLNVVDSTTPAVRAEAFEPPRTSDNAVQILEKQGIIKKCVESKLVSCAHHYLLDSRDVNSHFSYDSELDCWVTSMENVESFCNYLKEDDGSPYKLTMNKYFGKQDNSFLQFESSMDKTKWKPFPKFNIIVHDNQAFISNKECKENSKCCWKKEQRLQFAKQFYESDPVAQNLVKNFNFSNLSSMLPKEFLDSIRMSVNDSLQEEKLSWKEKFYNKISFIPNWFENIRESFFKIEWKHWFKRLAIIMGIFFFLGAMLKLWTMGATASLTSEVAATSICGGTAAMLNGDAVAEAFASGDQRRVFPARTRGREIAEKTFAKGNMNYSCYDRVKQSLRRNTFFISMYSENRMPLVGRCLGICGMYALVVDHYWEGWQNYSQREGVDDLHFFFMSALKPEPISCKFSDLKYTKISNSALGLVELKNRSKFKPFKDIRKLIARRETHRNTNGEGLVVEFDAFDPKTGERDVIPFPCPYTLRSGIKVQGCSLYGDYQTGQLYQYPGFNGLGRCGSILINTELQSPILGMHTAGAGQLGFAEAIYQEMFDSLDNVISIEGAIGNADDSRWFVPGETIGIGAVAQKFAHRANEKSMIIPSFVQIHGSHKFPKFTEPSVLSPKDPRLPTPFSPMLEGCKHHGKPLKPINSEHLKIAVADLQNLILAKNKPVRSSVGLLTPMQAVAGIPDLEGYQHLEWNSSEGFPFVNLRPSSAHNKKWLFTFDGNGHATGMHRLLESHLKSKWDKRNQGIVPDTVFVDCLKDCTVAVDKVLEPGKTRIFSISPVDFTIQQRQCTLDFVAAFMANRMDLEHSVGINPDSSEWAELAVNLLSVGDSIATGDYSKFGDTIPPEFIHAAFRIIRNWYIHNGCKDAELLQQLEIMPYEIANSVHLMFNHLYQCVCGQPSGNSLTVIINSIAGALYLRTAWLEIMRNTPFASLADYHKHVKAFTYGDDLIVSLSDTIKDQFNCIHWHSFFGAHKLKFTNADKGETIVGYGSIMEADFLKRGFRDHPYRRLPQVVLAPLKQESVEDTVNWVWSDSYGRAEEGSPTFEQMCMQVCGDSSRNAFGRGPKYYEQWRQKLIMFWVKRGHVLNLETWEQLDYKIFNLGHDLFKFYKKIFVPSYYNSDQFLEIK
ncbi:hypothetical protein [Wuhan spider virus 2]|uniref:hypothetical protein n=1 Tax=Wuhan spider virus 2 TaxID=1923751 RepID=UPI00090BE431|nr:hypothetical protein [Wuhan spider virus 2]APG77438.1 hypothetical protein [Wuhan spider virus 2]